MTPSKAIKAKCRDCQPERNVRDENFCEECALKAGGKSKLKAIRKYCIWCMNGSSKEVDICTSQACMLYEYRKGHNPALKGNPNIGQGSRFKAKNSAITTGKIEDEAQTIINHLEGLNVR